jgi:hypothetical protein
MFFPRGRSKGYPIPLPPGGGYANGVNYPGGNPASISPDGRIVAGSYVISNSRHCFVWHPGDAVASDIGLPAGYSDCMAYDIDKSGTVVGKLYSPSTYSAFVYRDGQFTVMDPANAQFDAVNAAGHAVGGDSTGLGGIFWDGHQLSHFHRQDNWMFGVAGGINSFDEAVSVGINEVQDTVSILVYSGGQVTEIGSRIDNPPGWAEFPLNVYGINDAGVIAGTASIGGVSHGFLLIPD